MYRQYKQNAEVSPLRRKKRAFGRDDTVEVIWGKLGGKILGITLSEQSWR